MTESKLSKQTALPRRKLFKPAQVKADAFRFPRPVKKKAKKR